MKQNRNHGIDLLRLVAMYGIVNLHVLWHGGILENVTGNKLSVARLLEVVCICAVNVYAIISGYVNYTDEEKKFKYGKYLSQWFPVVIYSFGITLALFLIKPDVVSIKQLILSLFPVTRNLYWYFTAYTFLFFMIPWFNWGMRKMTDDMAKRMVLTLLVLCSIYPTLTGQDNMFHLLKGYSALWLCVLYMVGAWMKKTQWQEKIATKWLLLIGLVSILATWAMYVWIPFDKVKTAVVSYISPTTVVCAIVWVTLFSRIKGNQRMNKIIAFLSPAAFGVYLIHEQQSIRYGLIRGAFVWIINKSIWSMPIYILGSAFVIFTGCLIIERIRISVFSLLMKKKV